MDYLGRDRALARAQLELLTTERGRLRSEREEAQVGRLSSSFSFPSSFFPSFFLLLSGASRGLRAWLGRGPV
jgi:hypothetical protein